MSERQYGGQSMAYMRVLTRGQFPRAASCKALYNLLKKNGQIGASNQAPIPGDLLLFPTVSPYGDMALYLGNAYMLIMQANSTPLVVRLGYYGRATFYIVKAGHDYQS